MSVAKFEMSTYVRVLIYLWKLNHLNKLAPRQLQVQGGYDVGEVLRNETAESQVITWYVLAENFIKDQFYEK